MSQYQDHYQNAVEQRIADEALHLLEQPAQLALVIGEQSDTRWWDAYDRLLSRLLSCPPGDVEAARDALVDHIMPMIVRHITKTTYPED